MSKSSHSVSARKLRIPRNRVADSAGLIFIALTGVATAFWAQEFSPDYRGLFVTLAPLAAVHFIAVGMYVVLVPRWYRWLALGLGVLAAISFAELTLRVA